MLWSLGPPAGAPTNSWTHRHLRRICWFGFVFISCVCSLCFPLVCCLLLLPLAPHMCLFFQTRAHTYCIADAGPGVHSHLPPVLLYIYIYMYVEQASLRHRRAMFLAFPNAVLEVLALCCACVHSSALHLYVSRSSVSSVMYSSSFALFLFPAHDSSCNYT